jgi:cytochrome P450
VHGLFQAMDPDALGPAIAAICTELLDEAPQDGGDFVRLVAAPLPAAVIVRLLGIPQSDTPRIVGWARDLRRLLDSGPGDGEAEAAATVAAMGDYFLALLRDDAWRKGQPAAALSGLVANYPETAVAANLAMLAFAGHETTVHLIGSLVLHLARRPGLWSRLRAEPVRIPAAVAEALRFESPVQKLCRWTEGPIAFDSVTVPDGQLLVLLIGAANRDPAIFPEPDAFDIDRAPGVQLGFGRGAHLCLGRSLALLEAETVLKVLLRRWDGVAVADGGWAWLNNSSFRGLRRLDLGWHDSRQA